MRSVRVRAATALVLLFAFLVGACASLPNRADHSLQDQLTATVVGMPAGIRFWADAPRETFQPDIDEITRKVARSGGTPSLLALSGGADDGAYGAGFLGGWSRTGNRPQFTIVSGVSTGALIAPYAFLGSDFDDELGTLFTQIDGRDIFTILGLGGIARAGVVDTAPLRDIVRRQVTPQLLEAVAAEHAKGRRLLVATTNLDAQRTVVWDMGRIAQVGTPRALEVFRQVLLASASVPGIFPPVLIEVQAGKRHFEELHVDGGAALQVFTLPTAFLTSRPGWAIPNGSRIYIIINNKLEPEFSVVPASALPIAGRSFSTLIKASAQQTVAQTFDFARDNRVGFALTFIGPDFQITSKKPFDRTYMNALYDYGLRRGRGGSGWVDHPPLRAE